jgi:transcriptional regulator with XRE-family HTH domain
MLRHQAPGQSTVPRSFPINGSRSSEHYCWESTEDLGPSVLDFPSRICYGIYHKSEKAKGSPVETFGRLIAERRRALGMTLAALAQQILKADGHPISVPYLGTLEQGRCRPSPGLIPQFAAALNLPEDALYFSLGLLPPDIHGLAHVSHQHILVALQMMRKILSTPDAEQPLEDGLWSLSLSGRQFRFGYCQQMPSSANSSFDGAGFSPLFYRGARVGGGVGARKRAALLRARQEPSSQTA